MKPVIPGPYEPPLLPADVAPTDAVAEPESFATCPTCHMVDTTLTNVSLAAGGHWRCRRCAALWDKGRIATPAAYAAWEAARQRRQTRR